MQINLDYGFVFHSVTLRYQVASPTLEIGYSTVELKYKFHGSYKRSRPGSPIRMCSMYS